MDVTITREPKVAKADHLFVLIAEGTKPDVDIAAKAMHAITAAGFTGRAEETLTTVAGEPKKITLVGIGKEDALTIRCLRTAIYSIAKMARKQRDRNIIVVLPYVLPKLGAGETTRVVADALAASDYKYDTYITKKDDKSLPISASLVPPPGVDAKHAKQLDDEANGIAAGIRTVRDLGNAPGNLATPTYIGQRAEEVAKHAGIKCIVYGRREIEKMKMGGLLAVNRGSAEEPRFIVLEYAPRKAKTHVALVGKGITFDSGGISIKPSDKMEEMKFDMCGAAAVIGTIQAAAMLALPVRVTGIIASTDNLPSGSAYKPGDIITTMSGKTVEIVNTDAEGRMILSDALHYASELKPDHILDYATLTGACVVALASEAAGLFTSNDELAQKLIECGERVGERLWRLPEC